MTLLNSVIFIRVCMGIERSYKIVQNKGKRFNKIDLPSHLLCITCVSTAFGGVSKRFQWVFGPLFSSYICFPPYYIWRGKQRTKLPLESLWNASECHRNTSYTQKRAGKSILWDLFPLFRTILYDRHIPIQTLINITLLRNVMLTATENQKPTGIALKRLRML